MAEEMSALQGNFVFFIQPCQPSCYGSEDHHGNGSKHAEVWNHAKGKFRVGKKPTSIKEKCDGPGHAELAQCSGSLELKGSRKEATLFVVEQLCLLHRGAFCEHMRFISILLLPWLLSYCKSFSELFKWERASKETAA